MILLGAVFFSLDLENKKSPPISPRVVRLVTAQIYFLSSFVIHVIQFNLGF